jgi:hypothetical protein
VSQTAGLPLGEGWLIFGTVQPASLTIPRLGATTRRPRCYLSHRSRCLRPFGAAIEPLLAVIVADADTTLRNARYDRTGAGVDGAAQGSQADAGELRRLAKRPDAGGVVACGAML